MPRKAVHPRKVKQEPQDYPESGSIAQRVAYLKRDLQACIEVVEQLVRKVDELEKAPPSTSLDELKALRDQLNGQALRLEALEHPRSLWERFVGSEE